MKFYPIEISSKMIYSIKLSCTQQVHPHQRQLLLQPTAPTPTGGGGGSCEDSPFRFKVKKNDGKTVSRGCDWVANKSTNARCKLVGVANQCPSTCNTCSTCVDSTLRFRFKFNNKGYITRDCTWVANKSTSFRCNVDGMEHTCRDTCGFCP